MIINQWVLGYTIFRHTHLSPNDIYDIRSHEDGVLELLETDFGGDANVADETGTTPLLLAAALGKQQIVQAAFKRSHAMIHHELEVVII